MNRIGLITRDNAGINACIRAVVRTAEFYNIDVLGFLRGYRGLIANDFTHLTHRSVAGIINLGGSILKAARCPEFRTDEGMEKAYQAVRDNGLSGLIVIGGNGSLAGAYQFHQKYRVPVVGIPSTIDNDINGVTMTIGADTAVNVALDALDKIRDTANSMERVFVVEVMGRDSGYIASRVALAGGAENVMLPELPYNCDQICEEILKGHERGKISWIVVVAEGAGHAPDIAAKIKDGTGLETRTAVLGHIQRGGRPTAFDRILAARLGAFAVETFKNGIHDVCVSAHNDMLATIPLADAVKPKDQEMSDYYRLIKNLT